MRVELLWLAVVALSLPMASEGNPLNVMSAPNLLRVGSKERIFVEVQDYAGAAFNVKLAVKNHPTKLKELVSKTVNLNQENSFQELVEIMIPGGPEFFDESPGVKQYVYLQAEFPSVTLEKVVLVSFQSGYIFVQTDKTIYTPTSKVLYRLFIMNPGLEPVTSGVSVEIMTPDNIIISKEVIHPDKGVKSGDYQLPEIVSPGIWKVVTRFQDTPQKNFTAEFEVKEYVLPSFEVTLRPRTAFFYVDDEELIVDITARYLYGKEVSGKGYALFGVITNDNEKKTFPGSTQRVAITEGKGTAVLKKQEITQYFQIEDLIQQSLFISVSVLTDTGSEMVQAEKRGILVVTSPYSIHFKMTAKYFKPGMPFDVSVYVTNPDGSPAKDIDVEVMPGGVEGRVDENGIAKTTINTNASTAKLDIEVKTVDPRIAQHRQANKTMTATPYLTPGNSKNLLHIGIGSTNLEVGNRFQVNLNTGNSPGAKDQDFTYLIVNKGQLVLAKRFKRQGQALLSLSLIVTKDMVPSFRFVAYYHVGTTEVVSDSVWVDVKDTCMGSLKVTSVNPQTTHEPRKQFALRITGDPGAKVGLVAVDKGVYVLNNKNRLTQTKIWDIIEKHDTGCTAGSGANSMGVFYDAGLVFVSSTAGATGIRTDPVCPVPSRRRRAVTILDVTTTLAGQFTGLNRTCCLDGLKENLQGYTCERRSQYIQDGPDCVNAFLHCCNELATKSKENQEVQQVLARSKDDDDYYISSDDIASRTKFPESWLWEDEMLPECPPADKNCKTTFKDKRSFMKDSITSWQITAISLSKTLGICVADPFEMIVLKPFFIDLRLPYSAVRNEQLEVKAILHNYSEEKITVRVELMETKHVCSSASKKGKHRVTVDVNPESSRSVPFVIIPMEEGLHPIEVKASVYDSSLKDGVKKDLRVVSEGVLSKIQVTNVELNPSKHGGAQTEHINSELPKNRVPNSPASTHISVSGEDLSQVVEEAIKGDSLGTLIVQPRGCGEQNMIYMTLPVIATHYLDTTNQWENVGLERRNEAVQFIKLGYTQELAYRKKDGSYAAWIDRRSSTWLTAYVAKVFAMASNIISVQEDVLCSALRWLVLNAQQPDGMFKEFAPVIHGEMVGNVRGKDSDESMTAFCLIAMQEGRSICADSINSLPNSIRKATTYLENRLLTLTNPYAVAMTSYALANEERFNKEFLFRHSSGDLTHWPVPGGHDFTLEATSYALLALVKGKFYDEAGSIVKWLNTQQQHGGGYGSTQATIMVFQAVAAYKMNVQEIKDIDLEVNIEVSGRAKPISWRFTKSNSLLTRTDKVQLHQNLTVTAKGTGEGSISITTLYYAQPKEKNFACKTFELDVTLEKELKVSYDEAKETYKLTIDVLYRSVEREATMSILDIGMLTGFIADKSDLELLATGRDRYIQKFESDQQLSEKGSLIIYLDKVSNKVADRFVFRIHKIQDVGLLQPAVVTVYEYYSPENRCVKFFHPQKADGSLNRICHKDVCQCAEENCSYQKKNDVKDAKRIEKACLSGSDYVYKVTLLNPVLTPQIDEYTMRVDSVIKEGTDVGVEGKTGLFLSHPFCREALELKTGKSYLVMGDSVDVNKIDDRYQYLLGEETWIEYWPTEDECQDREHRSVCLGIDELVNDLQTLGCPK